MKVGIYLAENDPTMGGGFTFQSNIIDAIVNLTHSRHEFYLFSYHRDILDAIPPKIHYKKCLLTMKEFKPSLTEKLLYRLKIQIRKDPEISPLEISAKKSGVHLMWYINWMAETRNIPFIYTVWDVNHRMVPKFPETLQNGTWEKREQLYKSAIQSAAYVVTGTERGRSEIQLFYNLPPERIIVNPFPVPSYVHRYFNVNAGIIKKFGVPTPYLLYPAQFWAHKNHIRILLALKKIIFEDGTVIHAVFVGSDRGNLNYIRNKINEFNLTKYVHILGFIPPEELVAFYLNSLALVFPSFHGPDNFPPLEAFALGCPAIASDIPGAREQLGDSAMLFNPMDENDLAEKIKLLYTNPFVRDELIAKGKERVSHLNADKYLEKIIIYLNEFDSIRQCWD